MKVFYNPGDSPRRNFTMCLAPLHGTPSTVENLVQYFELNRLLGAEKFIVYNYSITFKNFNTVLRYYESKGMVELVSWALPSKVRGKVWYYAQIAMLNDCFYRNKGVSQYIVNTDLDEFIVPLKNQLWSEFIQEEGSACEYNVRNVALKGNSCHPGMPYNSSVCTSVIQRPTLSKNIFKHGIRSKYVLRTDCQAISRIHFNDFPKNYKGEIRGTVKKFVSENSALVLHYGNVQKLFGNKGGVNTRILDPYINNLKTNVINVLKVVKLF